MNHPAPASPDNQVWVSPAEAAEITGFGPRTILRLANSGQVETVRTEGGHRRFRTVTVDGVPAIAVTRLRPAVVVESGEAA